MCLNLKREKLIGYTMKKEIHPNYREVVFLDTSSDYKFITKSTIETNDTITWENGEDYPLVKVEVSSASHPFYTGKKMLLDTAGRVEKFNRRYKKN
ncbi:50S ribosomal protein L31 type B [Cyclobacterium amurskyense]|uniref:Large ribosomal subunit protein bL31B n=2 Tax=Cyclobacterium amurskyense TaxID=320787 RepID=A0A0H4PPG9_9BACT|nr:50S ribosomal protein L31 type B [Cyclobacterium amurskyense]